MKKKRRERGRYVREGGGRKEWKEENEGIGRKKRKGKENKSQTE